MREQLRAAVLLSAAAFFSFAQTQRIDLAGSWTFDGGPIFLPGSTDQAGYGTRTEGPEKGWLSRPVVFEGPVTYQRTVTIPPGWRGQHITLFLERPHWQTTVSVDGRPIGTEDSLTTPHVYDLSDALPPGPHTLRIVVDNTYRINVGRNAHSVTDHTQTNWNGIVGRIELRATAPVWIEDAQVYPQGRVEVTVRNRTGSPVNAVLRAAGLETRLDNLAAERKVTLTVAATGKLWDEYEGNLQQLTLSLTTARTSHTHTATYGLRDFETKNGQFVLNKRPVMLRATLECNIFPLTGYPPTEEAAWARLFRIARDHGLNSFRFHSWCPPEAAFAAADRAGFLLYVELPVWHDKVGLDEKLDGFMRREGFRILRAYGNHPSFIGLGLGNELRGDFKFMDNLVGEFIQADPRRLFTFSADYVRLHPGETSEFFIAQRTKAGYLRVHGTRWGDQASGTDVDFSAQKLDIPVPIVAHELGQWVTYPNFDEIAKYTGVLKPRNLEAFRDKLAAQGMADQSEAFQRASGRFAWKLYKEDIETVLRTPEFGGYQLLQLQDFPGQGEALIGLLDSFWDSKHILTPAEMRGFAGPTVPLARFSKFVWTNDETFTARVQLSHFGKGTLQGPARWTLGTASGNLAPVQAASGTLSSLGEIRAPLNTFTQATQLKLTVDAAGFTNQWDIWVYPKSAPPASPTGLIVTSQLDPATSRKLNDGATVVLLAKTANTLPMRFLPVFWSLTWFPKQPGTMGILCDPAHPALADFPNEGHSDFNWHELTQNSQAFILDGQPQTLQPIVQVIDDYHRNHRLAAVIEARVGKGRLLAVSLDLDTTLLDQRPVARQLRHSLLKYAASPAFQPAVTLTTEDLNHLLQR